MLEDHGRGGQVCLQIQLVNSDDRGGICQIVYTVMQCLYRFQLVDMNSYQEKR